MLARPGRPRHPAIREPPGLPLLCLPVCCRLICTPSEQSAVSAQRICFCPHLRRPARQRSFPPPAPLCTICQPAACLSRPACCLSTPHAAALPTPLPPGPPSPDDPSNKQIPACLPAPSCPSHFGPRQLFATAPAVDVCKILSTWQADRQAWCSCSTGVSIGGSSMSGGFIGRADGTAIAGKQRNAGAQQAMVQVDETRQSVSAPRWAAAPSLPLPQPPCPP